MVAERAGVVLKCAADGGLVRDGGRTERVDEEDDKVAKPLRGSCADVSRTNDVDDSDCALRQAERARLDSSIDRSIVRRE